MVDIVEKVPEKFFTYVKKSYPVFPIDSLVPEIYQSLQLSSYYRVGAYREGNVVALTADSKDSMFSVSGCDLHVALVKNRVTPPYLLITDEGDIGKAVNRRTSSYIFQDVLISCEGCEDVWSIRVIAKLFRKCKRVEDHIWDELTPIVLDFQFPLDSHKVSHTLVVHSSSVLISRDFFIHISDGFVQKVTRHQFFLNTPSLISTDNDEMGEILWRVATHVVERAEGRFLILPLNKFKHPFLEGFAVVFSSRPGAPLRVVKLNRKVEGTWTGLINRKIVLSDDFILALVEEAKDLMLNRKEVEV